MSTNKVPVPAITPELIAYLERQFPDRCPDLERTDKEVWFQAGAASVVRHLKHLAESRTHRPKQGSALVV